jgi:hypothetical protein
MLPIRCLVFLAAVVLPALAWGATWRWYDASGQPHYTNVESHAPSYADRLGGRIGLVKGRVGRAPARDGRSHRGHRERVIESGPRGGSPVWWAGGSCYASGWSTLPTTGCMLPSRYWLVDAVAELERRKCQ